jgi:DNA replication protein DnaC
MLASLERTRLLIIDDWGPELLNTEQRRDLLEIVDGRYERCCSISNRQKSWRSRSTEQGDAGRDAH